MFKDKERDSLFLKQCLEGDDVALTQFNQLSYWQEVADATYLAVDRFSVGDPDVKFVRHIIAACISRIFEQYDTLPSSFTDLRIMIRRYAFGYARRYIRRGGRVHL